MMNARTAIDEGPYLVLSIHKEHAERIFAGTKQFELRKKLPAASFSKVFLYESGGTGLVGFFAVRKVLRDVPLNALWDQTGTLGTTRERFDSYYQGHLKGSAIAVQDSRRFPSPVGKSALREYEPRFFAPQSYLLISPGSPMHAFLQRLSSEAMGGSALVRLSPINPAEQSLYVDLVTSEISPFYDDIKQQFAESAILTHREGHDSKGFLTTRKEVLAARRIGDILIGFTTLTYKVGGSTKTGPTVLLPEYRGRGYGQMIRAEIERHALSNASRKLYATCPDTRETVVQYLLKAGFQVEAHLSGHYSKGHGELVFGRILQPGLGLSPAMPPRTSLASRLVSASSFRRRELDTQATKLFERNGYKLSKADVSRLITESSSSEAATDLNYELKPRTVYLLASSEDLTALLLLIPKRGGSAKVFLLSSTSHTPSLRKLLETVLADATRRKLRKLYVINPLVDEPLNSLYRELGFTSEGVLREPYVAGTDTLVLSKHLGPFSVK